MQALLRVLVLLRVRVRVRVFALQPARWRPVPVQQLQLPGRQILRRLALLPLAQVQAGLRPKLAHCSPVY